jgi:hypothetical protein
MLSRMTVASTGYVGLRSDQFSGTLLTCALQWWVIEASNRDHVTESSVATVVVRFSETCHTVLLMSTICKRVC